MERETLINVERKRNEMGRLPHRHVHQHSRRLRQTKSIIKAQSRAIHSWIETGPYWKASRGKQHEVPTDMATLLPLRPSLLPRRISIPLPYLSHLRGKKKLARPSTTLPVRLLKDVPTFGRKGRHPLPPFLPPSPSISPSTHSLLALLTFFRRHRPCPPRPNAQHLVPGFHSYIPSPLRTTLPSSPQRRCRAGCRVHTFLLHRGQSR